VRGRAAAAGLTAALAAAAPAHAASCLQVGVYEDRPVRELPRLERAVGGGVGVVSVAVTAGALVPRRLVRLAARRRLRLLVTFVADGGSDGARQRRYTLRRLARGAADAGLRRLARQLAARRPTPILRLLPEPNTPWYPWSGLVNGNRPWQYQAAWRHLRGVVRRVAGQRVELLWSPYALSVPDTAANAISRYFPGAANVDLVGADAYNFGAVHGLDWASPHDLFDAAYAEITSLAARPFWLAETGSTARGGSQAAWVDDLAALRDDLPLLQGVVWHDAADANGDFRLRKTATTRAAFTRLLGGSCR